MTSRRWVWQCGGRNAVPPYAENTEIKKRSVRVSGAGGVSRTTTQVSSS